MSLRVFFVGHAASRSGAPMILLNFAKWLRANGDVEFEMALVEPGPLLSDMRALSRTDVLQPEQTKARWILQRLIGVHRWKRVEDRAFARRVRSGHYDIAYVNTIVPTREIQELSRLGIPVICHVHELDFAMMFMLGEERVAAVLPSITHFIAASGAVGDYLTSRWKVPPSKVSVIHEFTIPGSAANDIVSGRARVRAELGLVNGDILVGSCGTLDWRKGADLFVQIARVAAADPRGKALRFTWIGADKTSNEYLKFSHDLRECGLSDRVTVIESRPNPADYFAAMDIFALTSREDPFPLVMLEAANVGLPIVCFASSGGGPEFSDDNAGLVAPYLDTEAFALHVLALAADPSLRRRLGECGRAKVRDQFTIDHQAPRLLDVIHQVARAHRR
jgi:glycosyltransferase involved in cell wall biosynthesis